jgi:phosphosulfolactate synthase (CoM biosynthesis protein A)
MGDHVDGLKFAGGAFSLFHEKQLRELVDLAHEHGVYISTVRLSCTSKLPHLGAYS